MPSIKQSAEFLQRAKDAGALQPVPSPVQVTQQMHAPDVPTYPEAPNSRLRSPLPANLVQQPDSQRQWFNPSISQVRLVAPTPASSPFANSAIQSQIAQSTTTTPTIPIVPPTPTTGQFYEINANGNFETIYSINGTII